MTFFIFWFNQSIVAYKLHTNMKIPKAEITSISLNKISAATNRTWNISINYSKRRGNHNTIFLWDFALTKYTSFLPSKLKFIYEIVSVGSFGVISSAESHDEFKFIRHVCLLQCAVRHIDEVLDHDLRLWGTTVFRSRLLATSCLFSMANMVVVLCND